MRRHQSAEENLNDVSTEKGRRLDEIASNLTTVREIQQRVQRRLEEMEQRPAVAVNGTSINKDATFDGEDNFPIEFLKDLRELQETYYSEDSTRWIGRHLTGEAAIWWRIVREQIKTFKEFEEAFMGIYWSATQQERVRDQLEYGRFNPNGSLNMIQYMERCISKSRQLIPILSDKHMITKLTRHYYRELQIAVVTRGVTTINSFETLLCEYMNINTRTENDGQKVGERSVIKYKGDAPPPRQMNNGNNKPRAGWRDNIVQRVPTSETSKPQTINSLVIERHTNSKQDERPSTLTQK